MKSPLFTIILMVVMLPSLFIRPTAPHNVVTHINLSPISPYYVKTVKSSAALNIKNDGKASAVWRVTYYPKNGGCIAWWPVVEHWNSGPGELSFICGDGKLFAVSGDYLLEQLQQL